MRMENGRKGGRRLGSSRGERRQETKNAISVLYWNVAGCKNKDDDFWKGLEK